MDELLGASNSKMNDFTKLCNRLFCFKLHQYNKLQIYVFSSSFILALTGLLVIVSLSYWHRTLCKYNENELFLSKDSPERNLLDISQGNMEYSNLNARIYCLKNHIKTQDLDTFCKNNPVYNTQSERHASSMFLPEESEIFVAEDFFPVVNVPTVVQKKKVVMHGSESEALSAVNMALKMKNTNKFEKALKLFRHALALQPLHPDVLNHYGEFVEEKEDDLIKADEMYFKALTISPDHSHALTNRKRTLPVVKELDEKELKRIDQKHVQLIELNHNNHIFKKLKRELYFQHIYHTVAIEGNTLTLDETKMVIQTGMPVSGKSLVEHMEVVGVESALRYINKTLVSKDDITVIDILKIHKLVLGHVKPQIAGLFRQSQVFVAEHTPPHASEVVHLMEEYVEWLQSSEFLQLHPIKQAALAHYKLVYIHPFIDGNGRTGRLIMNMILMRHGYPPVIIRNDERNHYFRTLQLANEGDVRPFVRFIARCTECTLNVYLHSIDYTKCLASPTVNKIDSNNNIIAL